MTERVTVLFPMAGRGERFGGTFKPFLTFRDQTFIEAALAPFRAHLPEIKEFVFAFLAEQEEAHQVTARLGSMFAGLPYRVALLPAPTRGPAETISGAVGIAGIKGPVVICDCDHAVQVGPIFERLAKPAAWDAVVPLWSLEGENLASWAVAALAPDGRIVAMQEKSRPEGADVVAGVVGCYAFADVANALRIGDAQKAANFSEILGAMMRAGTQVEGVFLKEAEFFGDPNRLNKALAGSNA